MLLPLERSMRRPTRPPKSSSLVLGTAILLMGLVLALPAYAAVPPQEPGVTLRTYDLQTAQDKICALKPGQTPNVDKLMPMVNWTTTADFGFADRFQSEVTGNVNIAAVSAYTFRLTSDDGSRLLIDGATVINHDGLHGVTSKEGAVTLTTGYHALSVDYFERDGGQQLTLEWRPPGASAFVVVPNSVLSTDSGVVRVTAPGRKECEASGDSPGDGLPLTAVHPGYTLTNLRPSGFQPQVSAMDFFPDGRLAIATWGGSDTVAGEVYILSGVTGATSPSQVTYTKIATGLREPMGLKIVDGKIYVAQKHELTELNDTNGDGTIDQYRRVATWPFDGNFHEFAFGLLYKDGFFYLNLSVSINLGGATTEPQGSPNRGTSLKINRTTGAVEYVAGGLRTPDGLGWGGRRATSSSPTTRAAGCPPRSSCRSSRAASSTTTPTRTARTTASRSPSPCCGCRRTRSPTRRAPRCCSTPGRTRVRCSSATSRTAAYSAPSSRRSTGSTRARSSA
nr:hypothetical protein GCM10020092_073190 [Actinoplanes digitatis]